jgi:hypothetical protein
VRKRETRRANPSKALVAVSDNSLPLKAVEPLEPFSPSLPLIPGAPQADLEFSLYQQRRYTDVVTQKNKDLETALKKSLEESLEMLSYLQSRLETGGEESREKLKYRVLRLKALLTKQAPLLNQVFTEKDDMPPALTRLILEANEKRAAAEMDIEKPRFSRLRKNRMREDG